MGVRRPLLRARGGRAITSATTRSTSSQNWRTPMLVIHGERDFRIPYSQSLGVFNALQRREHPLAPGRLPRRESLDPEAAKLDPMVSRGPWLARSLAQRGWQAQLPVIVTPAKAGVHADSAWMPACAGMTDFSRLSAAPMTELPKTFDPAEIEARWYAHWEERGPVPPGAARGRAVHDRHPAAQRHRLAPYRPRARQSRCRTSSSATPGCRARTRSGWSAWTMPASRPRWWSSASSKSGSTSAPIITPRRVRRQGLGVEGRERRRDHPPAAPARRLAATGRTSASPWTRASRRACSRCSSSSTATACSTATSAWSTGTRGLETAISDLEVETARSRAISGISAIRSRTAAAASASPPRGPRRCSPTWRSRSIPTTSATAALIGTKVRLPITGRLVPIIADEHADPELGSGAVKITPGHDFNDFEVGKRAGFKPADMLNMLDAEARVIQTADGLIPAELLGLDRFEARKRVVAMLEDGGLPRAGRGPRRPAPLWRPLGRGDRALADRPMVCRRRDAGEAGDRGGPLGRHPGRAGDLEEDLVQLAREHPALVRLAPALVGPPDPGLV